MENITGLNIQNHQASPRLVDIKIKNDNLDQVKQQFDQHDLIDIEYKPFLRFHITDIFNKVFDEKIQNLFNSKHKERISLVGVNENNDIEKRIFLQIIDFSWRSHLQYLEQLRQVIGLRSYGQKDPLSEFKKEAFSLFEGLLEKIKIDVIKFMLNLNIIVSQEKKVENKTQSKIPEQCLLKTMKGQKIQRNEKCEATGKKFKNCCGANL